MDIQIGNFVKTYNLCTGKVVIGKIEHIIKKDKNVYCWSGVDEVQFNDERRTIKIQNNTAIWDKRAMRWVFRFNSSRCACFSTIIVDACNVDAMPYRMLIDNEQIKYYF